MNEYNKAVLDVEEFTLNADIADASTTEAATITPGHQGGEGGLDTVGVEFEIAANGNDEI